MLRLVAILYAAAPVAIVTKAPAVAPQGPAATDSGDTSRIEGTIDKHPLRPADTSSPRATLHSFLEDTEIVLDDYKRNGQVTCDVSWRAYERIISTLDLSTTPNGNSRLTMARRAMLLVEILKRMELPPDEEIPGADEVARGDLSQWTIPGTRVTIKRIDSGPRAGEWLFSATTVERLRRNYLLVKNLPYRPGVAPGIYEDYIRSERSIDYAERLMRNRLRPVDTSSPRATLDGFLESMNRAYALVMEASAALEADPPTMTHAEAYEAEELARNLLMRAQTTLDLSHVPAAIRDDVGLESVLQIKEILDRMMLPAIDSVPSIEMVRAQRQHLDRSRPVRWRCPNTEIEIVEIMEGERQGQFVFSAATVRYVDGYYHEVRDLPYRKDYSTIAREYISPEISKGFYEYYITTPGHVVHEHKLLGRILECLPAWTKKVYLDQTVWQWLSLALLLPLSGIFLARFHGWLLHRRSGLTPASRHWRRVLFYLVAAGIAIFFDRFLDNYINLTGSVHFATAAVLVLSRWLCVALAVLFFGLAIAETVIASPKIDPEGIRASYIRALSGVTSFLAATAIVLFALSTVGVSLVPLLAGLGIGGLAIGMAARPTLEGIIGSFIIFSDSPYQVGERIQVAGQDGVVESIGLRSTKIRLLSGHLTSIPNEKMTAVEVENIGRRPYIRRDFNVTVTYDTPPEKIRRAREILQDILSVPETPTPVPADYGRPDDPGADAGEDPRTAEVKAASTEAQELDASDTGTRDEPPSATSKKNAKTDDMPSGRKHPNEAINQPGFPPRVYFSDLNADSLNLSVSYWFHPPEWWAYLEHADWINLQIMERFNAEGIDFAFPTQTLHLVGQDKSTREDG